MRPTRSLSTQPSRPRRESAVRTVPDSIPIRDINAPSRAVEITPPRSTDLQPMLDKCQQCKDAGIDAINIPDGPRASARISPMVAALAVDSRYFCRTHSAAARPTSQNRASKNSRGETAC